MPEDGSPEPLTPAHHEGAASTLAEAFIEDPGWVSIGPAREEPRRRFIQRTCLGVLRVANRWCGPSWCICDQDTPVGVLVGCAPERWPPPQLRSLITLAPGPILAGPAVLSRSLRAERQFEKAEPDYDHFLVWMFGIRPAYQRQGLGRRLMREALAIADDAGVPAYLYTSNPDNLPYYRSHGYEVTGESTLPGGGPNWFMERPAPAEPGRAQRRKPSASRLELANGGRSSSGEGTTDQDSSRDCGSAGSGRRDRGRSSDRGAEAHR